MNSAPARIGTSPPGGSIWVGFGIGWLVFVLGHAVIWTFWMAMYSRLSRVPDALMILIWLAPWLTMLGLAVMFSVQGKSRIGVGIALAVASILGLLLLLVAACFGLFAFSGWH